MGDYCTVRIRWAGDDPKTKRVECLATFEDLVDLLNQVLDRFIDEFAVEVMPGGSLAVAANGDLLGGFGVEVVNRAGSIVVVAQGREAWFLYRFLPEPSCCHSDSPPIDGTRAFYLFGDHHTELGADSLVSRDECLRALQAWLETGEFPGDPASTWSKDLLESTPGNSRNSNAPDIPES